MHYFQSFFERVTHVRNNMIKSTWSSRRDVIQKHHSKRLSGTCTCRWRWDGAGEALGRWSAGAALRINRSQRRIHPAGRRRGALRVRSAWVKGHRAAW